jgi:hypothetical protein
MPETDTGIGIPIPGPTEPQDPGITVDDVITVPPPVVQPGAPSPPPSPSPNPLPPSTGGAGDLSNIAWILLALAFLLLALAWVNLINWMSRSLWRALRRGGTAPQLDQHKTSQALSNWIGNAVKGIDPEVGYGFAASGKTVGLLGDVLMRLHVRVRTLAAKTGAIEHATNSTAAAQAAIRGQLHAQGANITGLQTQTQAIAAADKAQAATAEARLHALEQYQHTILEPELERLRANIPELQRGQIATKKRVDNHDSLLTDTAAVAGTAAALATLGGSWIRCDNNGRLGAAQCNLPENLLKDLLALLAVVGLGTFSLEELARWEKTIIGDARGDVEAFWRWTGKARKASHSLGSTGL